MYDTPNFVLSGVVNFDEANLFLGSPDRYTWKLVGKKELYVPYNNNRVFAATPQQLFGKTFANPDFIRWELHRVWVVEGTLAPGKRHVVPRRTLYVDEDTWTAVASDEYDGTGALWKFLYATPCVYPEFPGTFSAGQAFAYDFHAGNYAANTIIATSHRQYRKIEPKPMSFYSPDSLAAGGVR